MQIETAGKRILVIDDEANMGHMLAAVLKKAGYSVEAALDGKAGLERISRERYDYILCDIKMPVMGGMEFLRAAADHIGRSTVIMMSAYGSIDTAIEAMKQGAYDYISKPFKPDEVLLALRKAEERERLKRENRQLRARIQEIEKDYVFGAMIARSQAMQSVFTLAQKAARYSTTVLILGESGTGKELIARGIHSEGERARMPLVPVNCGGIPETLLESELFGYKKGAFTGADRDKKGLFKEADGGTIFLDEIGELPLALQVKLLRVLQESELRPVGESRAMHVDARVIAATAKSLEEEVKKGRFREDLFYRLNVLTIRLPPLRERPEDIPHLARWFLQRFNAKMNKQVADISPGALSLLLDYAWPGNVRELENAIERAVLLAEERVLLPEHLPVEVGAGRKAAGCDVGTTGLSLKTAQRETERRLITRALEETGGNRTQASRLLEISHPSLLTKIKAYNIPL
ncbi:MAG: sigma-54 dependent transcriptional regulator [Desulfobacterales bacterium]|jgi:two-component system response regulator AtoC|nr:sigma-54 dependent transcriptional regulator [Desulfobacterales bacterium]